MAVVTAVLGCSVNSGVELEVSGEASAAERDAKIVAIEVSRNGAGVNVADGFEERFLGKLIRSGAFRNVYVRAQQHEAPTDAFRLFLSVDEGEKFPASVYSNMQLEVQGAGGPRRVYEGKAVEPVGLVPFEAMAAVTESALNQVVNALYRDRGVFSSSP